MPVLRPFYVDSPSTWDEQDDGLDFSSDPDKLHDKLPQPFRLVSKILDSLLDNTWSQITEREIERRNNAQQKHLPELEGGIKVTLPYALHCVCSTPDDELVLGAGDGGILAFSHDDVTRPIYKYNIDKEYVKIQVSCDTETRSYVVVAFDTSGCISLFGLTVAGFIEIAPLSIEDEDKVLNISLKDSTLAVAVTGTSGTSLAFYSLPIQSWVDPFEQISKNRLQGSADSDINVTFAKPDLIGRIKQPQGVQSCSKNQLADALVPILNTLNNPVPLGQGLNHILPASYFENRRNFLSNLPKYKDIDWETADNSVQVPNVVFIGDSHILVWWTEHHIATIHTMTLTKDIENVENNYIFCSNITSVDSNNDLMGIGLESGMVSVICVSDWITLQTSLVSKSPVSQTRFVDEKLLAACQDGTLAVLSCTVGGSVALIQHVTTDSVQYSITQILPLRLYSNLAVVVLAPNRVAVVDVDSFRAIATLPVSGRVSVCGSLAKRYLCLVPVDAEYLLGKMREMHPSAWLYQKYPVVDRDDAMTLSEVAPEMVVYDVTGNDEVVEHGYVNTRSPPLTLTLLSESFFNNRAIEKTARHQRLRERWYQFTEELECY